MSAELRIRLRFSSIVNYLAIIYRIAVAIGFTVIVARRLSISEFGLWGIILSSIAMLAAFVGLWTYWVQRYFSRGFKEAPGTGLVLTLLYCIIATLVYVAIGLVIKGMVGYGLTYMLYSVPLLWLNIIDRYARGLSTVVKPELIGIRGFIYETLRIVLAYMFVAYLNMRLVGAITALEAALLVSDVYVLSVLKGMGVLKIVFSSKTVCEWFKGFSIPLLDMVYDFLRDGLRTFASFVTGSEVPVAYLNVGFSTYAPVASAATAAIPGLYARVLRRGESTDVEEVLRIFFFINSLLLSILIVLSRTIASLYNPKYVSAWVIVVLMSLSAFLGGLRAIFLTVIIGASRADAEGIKSSKQLLKSELFRAPLIRVLGSAISYVVGISLAIVFRGDYLMQALGFSVGLFVSVLVTIPWFMINALKSIKFRFPLKEITVGIIAGSATSIYLVLTGLNRVVIRSFWYDIVPLVTHLIVVGVMYLAIWYALSPWFRNLTRESLRHVLRTLQIE